MARIVCSLSTDQQKELLAEVAATVDDLIEDKKPFNLKSIVKEFYDFIYDSTGEVGTAKVYASLIPTNLRLSVVNKKLGKYLAPHLMDITELEDQIEKNIDYINQYLGITEEAPTETLVKFNEEEELKRAYQAFLDAHPPLPKTVVYSARPSTLFATTGESRTQGREFSYNFISNLIENVLPSDRSIGSITSKTNFYITIAKAEDVITIEDDPSDTLLKGFVQIITDAQGNTLYFDNDYNQVSKEQGRPVFFRLRENLDTVQTVEEIAKTLDITEEEVRVGLDKQYELVQKIKNFVGKGNKVVNIISSASIGYLEIDLSQRNPLKNAEDLSNNNILFDSKKVENEQLGKIPMQTYLFDRGAHRTPIPFKMNAVTSDQEFLEDSIKILTGQAFTSDNKQDKRLEAMVNKFYTVFYGQNKKIQIVDGVAHIGGKVATEEEVREALTVLRVNPKTNKPIYNTFNLYVDYASGSVPFYSKDEKGVIKMKRKGLGPIQYRKFVQEHAYTSATYNDKGEFREENGYFTYETPSDELNKISIDAEQSAKPQTPTEESKEQDTAETKGFKLSVDKKGKDQGKADLANALITYPSKNTSSYQYYKDAKAQGVPVNDDIQVGPGVIAMVSVNGNNKASNEQLTDTILAAREIIEAGGTVIMDSTADANRSWNASGEAIVQEQLGEPTGQTSKGYNYWGKNPEPETEKKLTKKKSKKASAQTTLDFTEQAPPPPPSSTDFSVDDYLSKFKRKNQKGEEVPLTKEEIDNIKNWWGKSPLSKYVDLRVMFDFVHREAIAKFVELSPESAAIYLYNGSDYTDLYHESWHAFFEMFTTPEERKDIYDTARQLEGTFVNTEGNTVAFANASTEDLDEYLADDFQDFMVEQDKGIENKERDSKLQKFFKGLLEVLKEFFNVSVEDSSNMLTPSKKLQEFYSKIRRNEIVYQGKSPNKGFRVFNKIKSLNENGESASYSSSKRVTDAISSLISQFVDEADSAQAGKFKRYSSTIMSSVPSQIYVFNYVRQQILNKRNELAKKLENTPKEKEVVTVSYSPGEVIISKDDIANYKDVVKQYGRTPKEFFTPASTFSVFYDNTTGKKGRAPQSSIWMKNDSGYYDLIDKDSGEVYIENVNLSTGKQMVGTPKVKVMPSLEYQRLYELYDDLDFAIKNFAPGSTNGEVITESSLNLAKETGKGTIAYYLKQTKHVSIEDVYESKEPDKNGSEVGRSDFRDRAGNEVSAQELASKELVSILSSLFEYENDGSVVKDEYGFPKTITFELAWNKILKVISGKNSTREMYDALSEKGKTDKAVAQFVNKMGFYEPVTDDAVDIRQINLWSDVYHIFSMPRIPLVGHIINLTENNKGQIENATVEVTRSKGNTRNIKTDWDNTFVASTNKNPYVVKKADVQLELNDTPFTGNYLNIAKVLRDFNKDFAQRPIEFLRALGMNVSDVDEIRAALSEKGMGSLRIFVRKMHEKLVYISNNNKNEAGSGRIYVNRPSQLAQLKNSEGENDTGAYEELLALEAMYSEKYGTSVVYNASNDLQFEYSLPSTVSKRVGYLNSAGSYGDLITDPRMAYLDVRDNPMTRSLFILEELFGENYDVYNDDTKEFQKTTRTRISRKGGRTKNSQIRIQNSAGISLLVNEQFANIGVKTFNTDEDAFTLQSFHMFLKTGLSFGIQHADKTTTYLYEIARSSGKKYYIPLEDFADYSDYESDPTVASLYTEGMNAAVNKMKQYLSNEIAFMYRVKNGDPSGNMVVGKSTLDKMGDDFYVFWDILETNTKNKIKEKYLSDNFLEEFGDETDLMEDIENQIANYFVGLALKNYNVLKSTGGLDVPMLMDPFRADLLNKSDVNSALEEYPDHIDWSLIQAFTVNDWIHKFETTVVLYGNPQMFDDPFKRDAGAAGTGETPRTDSSMNSILNKYFSPEYHKSKWFQDSNMSEPEITEYGITANTAILEDPEIESPKYHFYVNLALEEEKERLGVDTLTDEQVAEITSRYDEYKKMKIGDGQGWCTFDFYRSISIRLRKWGPYQESLYQKILKGENIKNATKFFPVLKLQYWGSLDVKNQLPGIAFHKFSVVPLVPNVIKNSKLEILHNKMVSQNIDYSAFLSASKINTLTENGSVDKFYENSKTMGAVSFSDEGYQFTKNPIFLDYLKNQQEQTDTLKGKTVFSTQLRTTALMNLYNEGVPTSFMPRETDNVLRTEAWQNLTENEKLTYPAYRSNKLYKQAVDRYSARLKSDFLKEAGVEENTDGTYEISNKLVRFIQKQLENRDKLGEHEIEFLSKISDFSLHFNSEEIEKMIMSLVYKKLINQKVNGEPLVQVSSAGFESADDAGLRNATEEENLRYKAGDLDFYTPGMAMKVKIALQGSYKFLLDHPDVKALVKARKNTITALDALNILIKDEEWLNKGHNRKMITMAGVRIPVQGLNSVEWAEVYEFLPENAGNMIIVPPEIVAKSGSDFDIDKLFMMFPNLIKVGNQIELVTYNQNDLLDLEQNKKTLKDLYEELDYEFTELEQISTVMDDDAPADKREVIYKSILEYKAEKETIKNILFSGDYDLSEEDKEQLHDKLHQIKGVLANLYNESKDVSKAVSEYMENVINPLFAEIANVKRKIASASTKGMQNDMLFSIIDIISLPENFVEFITPNGTYFVKPTADRLQEYVTDQEESKNITNDETYKRAGKSAMVGTRLFEFNVNNKRRSENNISKGVLGMGAVHNKYHSVKNIANAFLRPSVDLDRDDANFTIRQTIKMPHNIQMVMDMVLQPDLSYKLEPVPAVSLSGVYDVNKKRKISDINSQMINGWVDVAKDAWVFYVQGNKELAPVLQFLIESGVDYEQAVLFVSQPLIRKYADLQRKTKGAYAKVLGIPGANSNRFRDYAKSKIMTDYFLSNLEDKIAIADIDDISVGDVTFNILTSYADQFSEMAEIDEVKGFSKEDLETRIVESARDESKKEPTIFDYAAFTHFIELEEMTKADTQTKLTTNDDTQKIGTIYELLSRQKTFSQATANNRLRAGLVKDIMTSTVLGSFHISEKDDVLTQVLQSMFELSSHPRFIEFLSRTERSYSDYKIGKEFPGAFKDKEDFMTVLRNDFKIFVIQNFLFSPDRFNMKAPYKGYGVEESYKVQRVLKLDQGVALSKDGILYIDESVINKDVDNPEKTYLNNEDYVKNRKLAPMSMDYFQNANSQIHKANYVKFLYEREVLRSNIPFEEYAQTKDFKVRLKSAAKYTKALAEKYNMRPEEYVYETFLRDTALLNKLNIEFMLRDKENGYGAMFERFISTYPQILSQYPVLLSLRTTVNNDTRNMILSEPVLTGTTRNEYHDQLSKLADPNYKKVDNELDNRLISNLFSKLSFLALFQSGYTGKGTYNLSSIYPLDHYSILVESAKQKALKTLSGDVQKKVNPYLEEFMEMFRLQYKVGGYDEDTGIVTPYKVKRIKDYNNDLFYKNPKKSFFRPAPYNSSLTMFQVQSDPKMFLAKLANDKNKKIIYVAEASLSPASDQNTSVLGKLMTNSIFQDAVFQEIIPAEKVRALVTKKAGIAYEDSDFITDADFETSKAAIDVWIDSIKADIADGKFIVFSPMGYGKVYLGYGASEQAIKSYKLYSKGAPAPKTFVYLSKRLLELGYINPMFDQMAEFEEVMEKQPFTNEDVKENRRQCYKSLYNNG